MSLPPRFPSWIVFLAAALSTVTATAIATTAAVAVAEHDHLAPPSPNASCAATSPVDLALSRVLAADADLFAASKLTEAQVLHVAGRYQWFSQMHADMADKGAVAWAKEREATLRELAHDIDEMKRLEEAVRQLEAKRRTAEASAED